MTPEEKQLLISTAKKLDNLIDIYSRSHLIDKWVLTNPLVLRNTNIRIEGLNGVKIGENATDKLAFYGVTPVDQPATVSDPSGGATVDSESRTAINAIIDRLQELGLIA